MSTIRVTPVMQVLIVLAVLGLIAAIVGRQAPEIQRYLRVRKMD